LDIREYPYAAVLDIFNTAVRIRTIPVQNRTVRRPPRQTPPDCSRGPIWHV